MHLALNTVFNTSLPNTSENWEGREAVLVPRIWKIFTPYEPHICDPLPLHQPQLKLFLVMFITYGNGES